MESLLTQLYVLLYVTLALVVGILALMLCVGRSRYLASPYREQTGRGFLDVLRDRGAWFEYLVGRDVLRRFEGSRVLWNVYVSDGRGGTSECDVVAIIHGRMVVFECKAYSGWIFGRESDRYWTQTFNGNSKYRFYNPIRQNAGHVRALAKRLGINADDIVSVVVFSNACELKRVKVTGAVPVCRRWAMPRHLRRALGSAPSAAEDTGLFDRLYPLTQVDEEVKLKHVERIKKRFG